MSKTNIWLKMKYFLIITFCTTLSIISKALLPTYGTQYFELSFLAKKFGFEPVVIIWCFIVYCCVSYVFYLYEGRIQVTKIMKGFRYGISIGLLWFFAMLEMVSLKGSPIEFELMMGLSDAISVTILGLLLGIFTAKSKESDTNKKISIGFLTSILSIIVFSVVYLGGRYIFYCTNIISSGYQIRPIATFIWTLLINVVNLTKNSFNTVAKFHLSWS